MHSLKLLLTVLTVSALAAGNCHAGPYADDLSKCLLESTTKQDRVDLVQWMFAAASAHPAVQPYSSVTEEQLDAANKKMADLMMRLLTETCRETTIKALKYEGLATIESSFNLLGQVAGQELFASPEVAEALTGMEKYFDESKLEALVEISEE